MLLTDTVAMILDRHPESSRLLLIADQFEELYAPGDDRSTQERFLDQMLAATEATPHQSTPSFGMVLTMRADFYGHALSYRPFADALQGATLNLGPMSRRELEQTIEEPLPCPVHSM